MSKKKMLLDIIKTGSCDALSYIDCWGERGVTCPLYEFCEDNALTENVSDDRIKEEACKIYTESYGTPDDILEYLL